MSLGSKGLNIVLFSFTALSRIENISGKKKKTEQCEERFFVQIRRLRLSCGSENAIQRLLGLKVISIHATLPYLSGMNHQCHVNVLGAGEVPQGRDGLVLNRELVVAPTTTTKRVISTGTIHLFHSMEIFRKYCIKMLENPSYIVLSNSIVWRCYNNNNNFI